MSIDPPFDRLADAWMAEGPAELSDRVLDAALDQVRGRRQHRHRRATRWWGWPRLGRGRYLVAIAILAAMLIVAGTVVGSIVSIRPAVVPPPRDGLVPPTSLSPSARPTRRPSPTPRPQIPLTQTFTSTNNKLAISYPAGWTVKPATRAYAYGELLAIGDDTVDVIAAPDGIRAVYMVSEAYPPGMTVYAWERVHHQLMPAVPTECDYDPWRTHFVVPIEGATNYSAPGCGYIQVMSEFGDRGFQFLFFRTPVGSFSDEDLANRDLFFAMLKSAVLTP